MLDLEVYLRFVFVLIFVLALIAALAWVARRFGLMGKLTPTTGRSRRLSIIEVMALDARHKLVLLRRDQIEHLVLMGPGDNLLVEGQIPVAQDDPGPTSKWEATS